MTLIQHVLHRSYPAARLSKVGFYIAVLLFAANVHAAEIRGRVWSATNTNIAPTDATLIIQCGDSTKQSVDLVKDGRFSLRSLPANTSCTVRVSMKPATSEETITSASTAIRTNAKVVNFNAEARVINETVILLPR